MSRSIEILSEKFNNLDSEKIENEWKEIEKEGNGVGPERVEKLLKSIPGFSSVDMINFGEYCRSGFTQYELEEKTIEDHLLDWIEKVK